MHLVADLPSSFRYVRVSMQSECPLIVVAFTPLSTKPNLLGFNNDGWSPFASLDCQLCTQTWPQMVESISSHRGILCCHGLFSMVASVFLTHVWKLGFLLAIL